MRAPLRARCGAEEGRAANAATNHTYPLATAAVRLGTSAPWPVAALGAAIGGVVGGVIGLISAISDTRERWTEIPIGALQVDVGSIWKGEVTARLPFRLL